MWCAAGRVIGWESGAGTESLREAVEVPFGSHVDAALAVLLTYGTSPQDREVDRVRRDILILAKGDLAQLHHYTARATQDYRDVLMWAESPPDGDEPRTYRELRARLALPPDPNHEWHRCAQFSFAFSCMIFA